MNDLKDEFSRPVQTERWHVIVDQTHLGVSTNGDTQNGWFIRENTIKMDDFLGTPFSGNLHLGPLIMLI